MSALPELDRRVQRNLPLLHCYSFLLGLKLYVPVWLIYFRQLGLTDFQSGQLWAISFGASLLTDGITGVIADRWGYRKSLMLGGWLITASFIGFYLAPEAANDWWCLAASMALLGVAATFVYNSTPQAFGSKSAKKVGNKGGFRRVQGLYSMNIYLGSALGAALAWVAISVLPDATRLVWIIQAGLSFGLVAVAYATQDLDEFRPGRNIAHWPSPREIFMKSRKFLHLHGSCLLTLVPILVLALGVEPLAFTAQAYCESVHLGLGWSTALFAVGYMISGTGAFKFAKLQLSPRRTIVTLAALLAGAWLAMSCLPGWWQLVGIFALFLANGLPAITANALLDQLFLQYKATAMSVYMTVKRACFVVAWPAMGWMFQHWHFRFASLIVGLGLAAGMLVLAPLILIRTRGASLPLMRVPTPWAGQPPSLICRRGVVLYT